MTDDRGGGVDALTLPRRERRAGGNMSTCDLPRLHGIDTCNGRT